MNKNNSTYKTISIRTIFIITFISSLLISIGGIGYIVFSSWISSTQDTLLKIAEEINQEVLMQIKGLIDVPRQINQVNRGLLEQGFVDIKNEVQLDSYFVNVLKNQEYEALYSFGFGTESGYYYGARRNEKNIIEIMRNNENTKGQSWYYSVTEESKAGELVQIAGLFDPRTRDWYQAAKASGGPVFSPVYKHFVMNDLAVSAAVPIHDKSGELMGVLGSHVTLSRINNYLDEIVKDNNAYAVIVEKDSGNLIANSMGLDNFKLAVDGKFSRLAITQLENTLAAELYVEYLNGNKETHQVEYEHDWFYARAVEFRQDGLDWLVITAVPESLLAAEIYKTIRTTIFLSVLALMISVLVFLKIMHKVTEPINQLMKAKEKFTAGDMTQRATVVRDDEIGRIAVSFNKMADTIHVLINNLEEQVEERTEKINETNLELSEKLQKIEYLSFHDPLTSLYNRRYVEDSIVRLDTGRNLPLAVMAVDVNGMKLTNDAFGHETGDRLLSAVAEMLKHVCRADDIVGRMGGDEFTILLPKTDQEQAERIKQRILTAVSQIKLESVIVSLALGYAIKTIHDQDIKAVMISADNNMYKHKLKYGKIMKSQMIEKVLADINLKFDHEQIHTENITQYSVAIAMTMKLGDKEIQDIKTASILHDIGKIMVPRELLNKPGKLTDAEYEIVKRHSETSYQILKSLDEYSHLAEDVMYHHERPDGKGYPLGLRGEQISLCAKIIAVADAYEAMTTERPYQIQKSKDEAIAEMIRCSGTQFDPEIVGIFINKVLKA